MTAKTCSAPACVRPHYAKGYCVTHYRRLKRGTPIALPIQSFSKVGKPCAVEGCPYGSEAKGYCRAHYGRFHRHGNPLGGRSPRKRVKK